MVSNDKWSSKRAKTTDKWSSKRAKTERSKDGIKSPAGKKDERRRIKRLPLAAMEPNEEPIIESGDHFHEGGRRKGARILDGLKGAGCPTEDAAEKADRAGAAAFSGRDEWRRCDARRR